VQPRHDEIVAIIERVCHEHLNDEYAALGRKLAGVLARLDPAPLMQGRPASWACGIVYALGRVNFLSDPAQKPHMRLEDLCRVFGVSPATGSAKSRDIWDMLDLMQFDPDWTLPGMVEQNPLIWMLMVNGLIVDIRTMPPEVQDIAYRKGLIPYLPYQREAGSD
jgi:hypothetical protein